MNSHPSNYKKNVVILIISASIIRLLLSGIAELNNDEVHYWTYGKQLQWNYFDHPPMVAVWIRLFTAGLTLHHELFIRLGSVLGAAACTWLIYLTGRKLKDDYTGWIAACLFTASFYSSIIAGVLILPDSPQLVFWMLSLYLMVDIIKREPVAPVQGRLLLLGITIGLCILSKVHGVFCWAGFLGYCLFHQRSLLQQPALYGGLLITVAMLVPSFVWSIDNQFSTYDYHSARVVIRQIQIDSFFRELFGSFLYNNPVNVVLLVMALWYFRKHPPMQYPGFRLILWIGLPLILTVLFLSLFNDTLPHWSGPAYTTLIFITAGYLSTRPQVFVMRRLQYAVGLTAIALVFAFGVIYYWPGTLGSRTTADYGKNDVSLDMTGWRQFGEDFQKFYREDMGGKQGPKFIFNNYWFPAAHLDFYVARPMGLHVKAIGRLHDIHHFAWLNKFLPALEEGDSAYYITISNFNDPPPDLLKKNFRSIQEPVIIPQKRNGETARYFYVYKMTGYKTSTHLE